MHDIRAVRENPEAFDAALERRGVHPRADQILQADALYRDAVTTQQELQTKKNDYAKRIGLLKRQGQNTELEQADAGALSTQIAEKAEWITRQVTSLNDILSGLPNRLDDDVPPGVDETSNIEVKRIGTASVFAFLPKQHFELGEALGLMDFEGAARIAGARFTILRGALAKLERALGQFMIDLHTTEHGYEEIAVPGLVNGNSLYGTGQLPKFSDDCFVIKDEKYYLIPTAEVPLTNLLGSQIIPRAKLPIRMTALTDCYRSEAGSAGRDTRGMLRQHQFRKVEMVSIVAPEDSDAEHERMTRCAETVLEKLALPYRRMLLCAGDTGFSAAKTFDLEVWLPGQNTWREISSCSNCRDFQARRMNARYRLADGKTIAHVHTLNGSGVAVGRALIAVMENYQDATGAIHVPDALRPYMGGIDIIRPASLA